MADLLRQGCPLYGNTPIFRTGSGKSAVLKQSSIAKALAVLGGGEDDDDGEACGGDNEFGFLELLEKGNEDDGNAPIFHAGSGKSVVLRQSLIAKAMSVQQFVWKPSIVEQFVWQDLSHSGMKAGMRNNGVIGDDLLVPRSLLVSKSGILKSQLVKEIDTDLLQPEAQYSAPKPPPFKFHTAGGRSFSVSSEALKRARSLLGDPDIGAFLNEGDAFDMGLLVFEDIIFDEASSNKENSFYTAFTHPEASKIISGGNLLEKFDAVHNDSTCEFNNKANCIQNCLMNGLCSLDTTVANSLDSGTGSRMNPLQRLLLVLLVDISNKNGTAYSNNCQVIFSRDRPVL